MVFNTENICVKSNLTIITFLLDIKVNGLLLSFSLHTTITMCVCLTLSTISGPVLEAQSGDIHAQEGEEVAMWVQGPHSLSHMDAQVYFKDDIEEEEYNNIIP